MASQSTQKGLKKQKRAQGRAGGQLQVLETLLDTIPSPVFYKDVKGVYTGCNKAFQEFVGRQAEEIIGKTVYDMGPKEIADKYYEKDQQLFRKPGKQEYEWKVQTSDGEVRHVVFNKATIVGAGGKIKGLIGVISDITARKRAEDALRESETRLRALLNASTETILLIDPDGFILCANDVLAKRLGMEVEDFVGKNVYDFLPREVGRRRKKQGAKVMRTGSAVRFEDEREGIWMDNTIYPVTDGGGQVLQLAIFSRDITRQKRAEAAIKKREAALKAKTSELGEVNSALRVLLDQRQRDRKDLEEKVVSNIKELALPYIDKLKKSRLDSKQMTLLKILDSNLKDIVSPFIHQLSSKYSSLTPMEIQVAQLVKEGRTTKEIAELMGSSRRTVESHREKIRIKLDLKNKKVNLRSYLSSM